MSSKIKIAPSTKTGSHHWIMQRLSAIALIPLVLWLAASLVSFSSNLENLLPIFFANPLNAIAAISLIAVGLYHGALGLRVIIEDYVTNKMALHFLVILVNFISLITAVAALLSIIKLHLIG